MKAKYIKHIIAAIFAIVAIPSLADSFEVGGLWYEIDVNNSRNVIVVKAPSGYSYSETSYTIPENVIHGGKNYTVVAVGDKAFFSCRGLAGIVLPNTVTSIGVHAFSACAFSSVTLPSGLKQIGNFAFYSCRNLSNVTLPSSITRIGDSSFSGTAISSVFIPKSLTSIGPSVFNECKNLSTIQVENGNPNYYCPNGSNAIFKGDTLYVGCKGTKNIPNGITTIADYAFFGSRELTEIVLPSTVTSIGVHAFTACAFSSITLPSGLKHIGNTAFYSCSNLSNVILPSSITKIGDSSFSGTAISSVFIPKSLTSIGHSAFSNCKNLSTIQVENGNPNYYCPNGSNAIFKGDTLYIGCKGTKNIPNGITTIADYAFFSCRELTEIVLPSSVTSIGVHAFSACAFFTVTLPSGLKHIGNSAFYSCSNLSVVFSLIVSPFKIDESAFNNIDKNAILNVPLGTISRYREYEGWTKHFKNIVEFDPNCFEVDGIYYKIDEANPDVVSVTSGWTQYSGDITIPSSVTYNGKKMKVNAIGEKAFFECRELVSVELPGTITQIGRHAFQHCDKLTAINLPSSLTHIRMDAFANCISLSELNLPSSLTDIETYAFFGSNLSKILIPKSTIRIGHAFLSGCKDLTSIQVEYGNPVYDSRNSCNAIIKGDTLVAGCRTTIIPQGIKVIGIEAMSYSSGVTNINLPSTITTISAAAFRNGNDLYSVELPASISAIAESAFDNCYNLREVTSFMEDVFGIDDSAFKGAYDNATLYVPKGKVLEYRQTAGWRLFKTIREIPDLPTTEREGIIYAVNTKDGKARVMSCLNDLRHAIIQESIGYEGNTYVVDEVCDFAFANKAVVSVLFPKSVKQIGTGVFNGCSDLSAIDWQVTSKPTAEFVKDIVNPNLLFYVTSEAYKPDNIGNVIVNGNAGEITLTDSESGDFHIMKTFTAKKISYTHKYSLKTEKDVCEGWETIALPFDVQTYMTPKGEAKPYKVSNSGERFFWLRELTATGMVEAEGIKANVPYIISMPNWEGYQDFYNIEGEVKFSAQNVTIVKTDINAVDVTPRHFWPNFQHITRTSNCFALNKQHLIYHGEEYLPGSVFLANLRDVKPFEAYFTYDGSATARAIAISDIMSGPTSIQSIDNQYCVFINGVAFKNIPPLSASTIGIYSTTGQLVKKVVLSNGRNEITGLQSGIYIINGTKVLVK